MGELAVLQAIRLKGRVGVAALAETLDAPQPTVAAVVAELAGAGLLVAGEPVRLSDAGRVRCDQLLAAERATADARALVATYRAFGVVNAEFKATVTDWQLNRDDAARAAALDRLGGIHRRVLPIIAAAAAQLPRLNAYTGKLETALDRVLAGDSGWLARPLVDSYHTVWFELHEELIRACGLTRRSDG